MLEKCSMKKFKRSSEYRKENNYDVFFDTYITPFCKKMYGKSLLILEPLFITYKVPCG